MWIRCTRRRRSVSSWVSPGPLVPMPPACWRERAAGAAKPRQSVLQERELDLGLALGGARVLGEDVEDDRGAVDRRAPEDLLEVALLGGREIVFEHHRVRVDREADARAAPATLPEPRKVAGSGASRRWTTRATTSAPAVSTSSASSSSWCSSSSGVTPGKRTPTRTIFSRNVRSMSVSGCTSSFEPLHVGDELHRVPRAWPCSPSSSTAQRAARVVDDDAIARTGRVPSR